MTCSQYRYDILMDKSMSKDCRMTKSRRGAEGIGVSAKVRATWFQAMLFSEEKSKE